MSRSNQLYMETMEAQPDDSDYQYFRWLTDQEWQLYLDKAENDYHAKYGFGATFLLLWSEFLIKNGIK